MKSFEPIKLACNHLIGDNHTQSHKYIVGTFIMLIGVLVSKIPILIIENEILSFLGDTFGYLIHGVGAIPYVEQLIKIGKNGTSG